MKAQTYQIFVADAVDKTVLIYKTMVMQNIHLNIGQIAKVLNVTRYGGDKFKHNDHYIDPGQASTDDKKDPCTDNYKKSKLESQVTEVRWISYNDH